jgi:hypothetical protein
MGRDLATPGLGWAGHVGLATRYMMNASGMSEYADQVIEVLNDPNNVGQLNTIPNFKSRSPYWGSRYGRMSSPTQGYNILVEANHQRWWTKEYTIRADYRVAQGNPSTGQYSISGRWRCDTFVWYAYYSQGINLSPNGVWLPSVMFNAFPYANDERLSSKPVNFIYNQPVVYKPIGQMSYNERIAVANKIQEDNARAKIQENISKDLRDLTIDDLISMTEEEIQIILNAPKIDSNLMINLLKLYEKTDRKEIKKHIISGLMFYNQLQLRKNPNEKNKILLKHFFSKLLYEKHDPQSTDWITMGFIDSHTTEEIVKNLDKINDQLASMSHKSSIILKYSLVYQSKELEPIYIRSIIDELRKANNADLDDFFFGPLSIGYNGTGKDLLLPESRKMVIDYLKEVRHKYTPAGIKKNKLSHGEKLGMTPMDFENLIKAMNIKL